MMKRVFSKKPAAASLETGDSTTALLDSKHRTFPCGLLELHKPEGKAIVDIVFIHGLTGDRTRTWTAPSATASWPQAILPEELPAARILTFGYDAYVADWRRIVSKNRVRDHARNLVAALATHRVKDGSSDRPIVFVAHSLGGIVCEDALLISGNSAEPRDRSVLAHTHGVAFLGTPHTGAGLAIWAERLAKFVGLVAEANVPILQVLREDSEVLARIETDFQTMLRARQDQGEWEIGIRCFYEEIPLPKIGCVVPAESAILPAYPAISIHANHMDMTKFSAADDPGFVSVVGELRSWVKGLSLDLEDGNGTFGGSGIASNVRGNVADKARGISAAQVITNYGNITGGAVSFGGNTTFAGPTYF